MHKVKFVQAYFGKERVAKTVHVPTGERKPLIPILNLFKYDETTPTTQRVSTDADSDCIIDGARLAADIETLLTAMESEGFRLQQVIPVLSGAHEHAMKELGSLRQGTGKTGGMAYGFGFSFTEGVIVILSDKKPGEEEA